jgi:tetratricopeptide (TPR) repeat protein
MRRLLVTIAALLAASPSLLGGQGPAGREQQSPLRPRAASQQELDDYRAALGAGSGATLEQAADAFAMKYPQSELRKYLLTRAMSQYQLENNAPGMLATGEKVLALDPGDSLALVLTATVVADSLGPTDADRDRKIAEVKRKTARVIQDTTSSVAGEAVAPRVAFYRNTLEGMAYSALGLVNLKTGDYEEAEKDLRAAVDLCKTKPDPSIWYHLALAQDHRRKFRAALNSVEQALQLASSNPELQKMAEVEHERLTGYVRNSPDSGGTRPPD